MTLVTGINIGAHRLIEEKLKRPLSHFNCLNHAAERPVRQLMAYIDGPTDDTTGT
jgi:hypothetical protein